MSTDSKYYALVDGILAGTALSNKQGEDDLNMEVGGLPTNSVETRAIRYALRAIRTGKSVQDIEERAKTDPEGEQRRIAQEDTEGLDLVIKTQGKPITVFFRRNNRKGQTWFLNVQGNPTSTFSGDNTFGDLRIATKVIAMFHIVLDKLAKYGVNTGRLRNEVEEGHIHINSIAFAQYLTPVDNEEMLRTLVQCWYSMYETRIRTGEGQAISLLQELGLKRSVGDQFERSIALALYNPSDRKCAGHKLMHVCFYDKAEEKRVKGGLDEESEVAQDLGKRLRIDLTVSNYYLKTHWNLPVVTLRSMYDYVRGKYERSGAHPWECAVQELMTYALRRTCLLYMFVVPNPFLRKHRDMRRKWVAEYKEREKRERGRKPAWSTEVQKWADEIGLNLGVSPLAHKIMKQGHLDYHTHTPEMLELWASGTEQGRAEYMKRVAGLIEEVRNNTMLTSVIQKLGLENSAPSYLTDN